MFKWMRAAAAGLLAISPVIEAGLVGLLFIQALRFLIGDLYSQFASGLLVSSLPAGSVESSTPGVVDPSQLSTVIMVLSVVVALPLLAVILGRWRGLVLGAAALTAIGRALMVAPANDMPILGAELAVGGGLLYLALLIHNRATLLPYFFLLGIAGDQVIRALGDTVDPTWSSDFYFTQIVISVAVVAMTGLNLLRGSGGSGDNRSETHTLNPDNGLLTLWGGVGLGAMLFVQLSFLGLPNALAGRSDADYTLLVPAVIAATLLPLVPAVRVRARNLLVAFDNSTRGWVWLIIVVVLVVFGTRVPRISLGDLGLLPIGGATLVLAQLTISLAWWWFVRPRAERERNMGGLWLVLGMGVFALLVLADIFTYEYAFVRDFAPPLDSLNAIVPPLLRGLRGMGLGVILLAILLSLLPMILATRRIPWTGGKPGEAVAAVGLVGLLTVAGGIAAQPPVIQPVLNVTELRIGTYNIHGGYSEFYAFNLPDVARAVQSGGADVVLLQEVEMGRLTSYGVDQTLWLARRLGMDRRVYPTNEGLQGLAVLSRVPIVFADGALLTSIDQQTGLQRVQIRPDEGAITLYNTALGLLLAGETQEEQERNQRRQLDEILAIINAHVIEDYGGQLGRAVLGGTFHNIPDSPLLETLQRTGFVDPFAGLNPVLSNTLVRTDRRARIDYLWLWGQTLRATGTNVIANDASDHRLAVVGVQIRQEE